MSSIDDDATIPPEASIGGAALDLPRQALVATIAFHPDIARIGRYAVLNTRAGDGKYTRRFFTFGRYEPSFSQGGQQIDSNVSGDKAVDGVESPLSDAAEESPHGLHLRSVSRKGVIELEIGESSFGFAVHNANDALKIGDWPNLSQRKQLSALKEGVVVQLADDCVIIIREVQVSRNPAAKAVSHELFPGVSAEANILRSLIHFAATETVNTLVVGGRGVGKERAAVCIHRAASHDRQDPVIVSIPSIPDDHAVDQIFGIYRSKPADQAKSLGCFREAEGGTLILNDVDKASPIAQPPLMTGMDGRVQPVGDSSQRVNCRVVGTAEISLQQANLAWFAGRFQHVIAIPPLVSRPEDLAFEVCRQLIQEGSPWARHDFEAVGVNSSANVFWANQLYDVLTNPCFAKWRGNFRDIARYVASGAVSFVEAQENVETSVGPTAAVIPKALTLDSISDQMFDELVESLDFELRKVAKELNVGIASIYRRIDRHPTLRYAGIVPEEEVLEVIEEHDGNVVTAAKQLRVSVRGLRSRHNEILKKSTAS